MLIVHAVSAFGVLASPEDVLVPDFVADLLDVGDHNQPEIDQQADSNFRVYYPANVNFRNWILYYQQADQVVADETNKDFIHDLAEVLAVVEKGLAL